MPHKSHFSPMTFSPRPADDFEPFATLLSQPEIVVAHREIDRTQMRSPNSEMSSTSGTTNDKRPTRNSAQYWRVRQPLALRRGRKLPAVMDFTISPELSKNDPALSSEAKLHSRAESSCDVVNQTHNVVRQIGKDSEGVCDLISYRGTLRVVKSVRNPFMVQAKPVEAEMLRHVSPEGHDNIIKFFGYEYIPALNMVQYHFEYCSGGDLHQLCSQYAKHAAYFPEAFIWKVYLQLNSALEFLHRGFDQRSCDRPGIVHRDVKPENVFLRPSASNPERYPEVVLGDFGCATFDFATYTPFGTPKWQGPEIPRKSTRGDVWSMGAVIHQMIHLQSPIMDLPAGVEATDEMLTYWEERPETRAPIIEVPHTYSQKLIDKMLAALEMNHNKRTTSERLLINVKNAIQEVLIDDCSDEQQDKFEPLALWAFDLTFERVANSEPEDPFEVDDGDEGRSQYFEMMIELAPDAQITVMGNRYRRYRDK